MSYTERNHGRSRWDQAAERKRVNGGGNGRADTESNSGVEWIRSPSPSGDDNQAMTCLLRRMYRDIAEEPLPATFNALVRRLRGSNTTNNGNGSH